MVTGYEQHLKNPKLSHELEPLKAYGNIQSFLNNFP